jgi:hypothetical protein
MKELNKRTHLLSTYSRGVRYSKLRIIVHFILRCEMTLSLRYLYKLSVAYRIYAKPVFCIELYTPAIFCKYLNL